VRSPALLQLIRSNPRFWNYTSRPRRSAAEFPGSNDDIAHVTIIRPVKGLEAKLYECLASTFQQTYPTEKLTIHLCIASKDDPAYPVLQKVLADFPLHDARIFVESEDPLLHGSSGNIHALGPNPKVRNISRGYREAKGDIIWIIDCNIWVSSGVTGRMVGKLCGRNPNGTRTKPFKFVHQLPIAMDLSAPGGPEQQGLLSATTNMSWGSAASSVLGQAGGRLDEMFLATSHAKFYSAINTVGIAPCINGKSNMFRKSHLDTLTDPSQNPILPPSDASRRRGIDFFSSYICEDHLIGDLLWRSEVRGHGNHGLVTGDLAIQPVSDMSVAAYIARRVRWLRVRKWTVIAATLVEPGVESLVCNFMFAFAMTTLPQLGEPFGIPQTWGALGLLWLMGVAIWMVLDRLTYNMLHACKTVEVDSNTPDFARGIDRSGGIGRKPFGEWFLAWLGREFLAFPIWAWAVLFGTTVTWRGKSFRVGMDMRVVELDDQARLTGAISNGVSQARERKRRAD